jgi:hypothetical protein
MGILPSILKYFNLCFFVIILNFSLLANGGPVDWSTVLKTGRIQLVKDKFVNLLKEDLSVIIEGDYTYVKVNYAFKNRNTDKDTNGYDSFSRLLTPKSICFLIGNLLPYSYNVNNL